ncbi:MAG TPA: hypothetical protein DD624_03220 [Alphaproteobacteria bacterium]|nr:hypothetical protein [Alphaproteobacteria bacterium]
MKNEHEHCCCGHHDHHHDCGCGHSHDHECGCGHEHCEEHKLNPDDYRSVSAMFGLDDEIPDDAFSLLQTEMNECDELGELLGVDKDTDVDDLLAEALEDLSVKKKKTLLNLALILHDYIPD